MAAIGPLCENTHHSELYSETKTLVFVCVLEWQQNGPGTVGIQPSAPADAELLQAHGMLLGTPKLGREWRSRERFTHTPDTLVPGGPSLPRQMHLAV